MLGIDYVEECVTLGDRQGLKNCLRFFVVDSLMLGERTHVVAIFQQVECLDEALQFFCVRIGLPDQICGVHKTSG